jgi:hypothetical protein
MPRRMLGNTKKDGNFFVFGGSNGCQKDIKNGKGCQVRLLRVIRGARKVNVSWMKIKISSSKIDESENDFIDNLYHHGLLMFGN